MANLRFFVLAFVLGFSQELYTKGILTEVLEPIMGRGLGAGAAFCPGGRKKPFLCLALRVERLSCRS